MPYSALKIRPAFASFDAERRFGLGYRLVAGNKACECGAILRGVKKPTDCKIFGTVCTPENPMGSCMVSSEIRYVELGPPDARVGCLSFDFYNGAMSTAQCERLLAALREARQRDTRVLVLLGGRDFFSNGIHLNCIEVAAHRSALLPELSAIPQFGYLVTSGAVDSARFSWSGAMRYRGLIATIVAMSGLFLSSTAFAQAPHVLVADEVYDFGSVKQGVRIKHDFKVRNVGDAPNQRGVSARHASTCSACGYASGYRGNGGDRVGHQSSGG